MTLTLPPEFLQTKNTDYDARRLRFLFRGLTSEGIGADGEFAVSQRAAGANLTVDVAAGRAWIEGDDTARQGLYHIYNDAPVNVALPAADPANPRIDQVVLRIYDTTVIGGGIDEARFEIAQGTPTAGASLANPLGIAAVPASALPLARVLVGAGAASVANAQIQNVAPVATTSPRGGGREIVLHQPSAALLAWTNMPAALTEFPSAVPSRSWVDLSAFTQAHVYAYQGVAGAAAAALRVQYSNDQATWSYLDGATGPSVTVGAGANQMKVGSWVTIDPAVRWFRGVHLRLVGVSGDGAIDPSFGKVALVVR
jgi:hypothetical protein